MSLQVLCYSNGAEDAFKTVLQPPLNQAHAAGRIFFSPIECLFRVRTDGLYYLEKKSHDPPILTYCSAKIIRSKDVRLSDFGNILM